MFRVVTLLLSDGSSASLRPRACAAEVSVAVRDDLEPAVVVIKLPDLSTHDEQDVATDLCEGT